MNDYEIKTMYDQVQRLEEGLKMLKETNCNCNCCQNSNCDCCKKED